MTKRIELKEKGIDKHRDAVDHWDSFTGLIIYCKESEAEQLKSQILQDHEIVNRLIKQIEEFKEKDFGYCMSTLLEIRDEK